MLSYCNGNYAREITIFGVTFFWRHKHKTPVPSNRIGRLSWERF